jgi:hypothetical protein
MPTGLSSHRTLVRGRHVVRIVRMPPALTSGVA